MKYKKDYFLAFLLTFMTCYILQATRVLNPEDAQDKKGLSVACLPIENQLSANLAPELSDSQASSKKLSDIIQASHGSDLASLNNLTNDLLSTILGYVGVTQLRAVSKLFYYHVTGEFVEDGTKAKGISEGTHSQGISSKKRYCYDFKKSRLYVNSEEKYFFNQLLLIEQIPTWFWQRWIKEVDDIPINKMGHLKGTNIHTVNFVHKNWPNLLLHLHVYAHEIENIPCTVKGIPEDFASLYRTLKDTNVIIINLYNNKIYSNKGIHKDKFIVQKKIKDKNIQISMFIKKSSKT